jgi:SAM-dependent methyltransferase
MKLAERLHEAGVRRRRVRVLASHLGRLIPPDLSVLDVGSGDGQVADALGTIRPDLDIRGVDVLVRLDAAIRVQPYDGRTLPFGNGSFGAAVLVDVLHHTNDPAVLLAEAARVAPLVIVKDHVSETPFARALLRFMDRVGNARFDVSLPYCYWSRKQWGDAFTALGLVVEVWIGRLGLYPAPVSWLFDGSLHFVARLRG